jgi:hypothetical protein
MQFRISLNVLNGFHFQRNVIGCVGVEHQYLAVGLHDSPGETITIFECDLIGEEQRREDNQTSKGGEFKMAQHDCLRSQEKLVTTSEPRVAMT